MSGLTDVGRLGDGFYGVLGQRVIQRLELRYARLRSEVANSLCQDRGLADNVLEILNMLIGERSTHRMVYQPLQSLTGTEDVHPELERGGQGLHDRNIRDQRLLVLRQLNLIECLCNATGKIPPLASEGVCLLFVGLVGECLCESVHAQLSKPNPMSLELC